MGEVIKINTQQVILRIILSIAIGGLIGIQREISRNSAGFRTHMLVCLGACLAMLTNEYLYRLYPNSGLDIGRMGSYVISGIGFIGAGSILKDGARVRGLTTAAGLWVVACLGIAIGSGFYLASIFGAVIVVIILTFLKIFEDRFLRKRNRTEIQLEIKNSPGQLASVLSKIGKIGVLIKDVNIQDSDEKWINVTVLTTIPNSVGVTGMHEILDETKGVKIVSIELT